MQACGEGLVDGVSPDEDSKVKRMRNLIYTRDLKEAADSMENVLNVLSKAGRYSDALEIPDAVLATSGPPQRSDLADVLSSPFEAFAEQVATLTLGPPAGQPPFMGVQVMVAINRLTSR